MQEQEAKHRNRLPTLCVSLFAENCVATTIRKATANAEGENPVEEAAMEEGEETEGEWPLEHIEIQDKTVVAGGGATKDFDMGNAQMSLALEEDDEGEKEEEEEEQRDGLPIGLEVRRCSSSFSLVGSSFSSASSSTTTLLPSVSAPHSPLSFTLSLPVVTPPALHCPPHLVAACCDGTRQGRISGSGGEDGEGERTHGCVRELGTYHLNSVSSALSNAGAHVARAWGSEADGGEILASSTVVEELSKVGKELPPHGSSAHCEDFCEDFFGDANREHFLETLRLTEAVDLLEEVWSMCACTCVYACVGVCVSVRVCDCVYVYLRTSLSLVYICVCVYMFVYMFVCMFVCRHVCRYVCMYVFMFVCLYVCMYACMHACMHAWLLLTTLQHTAGHSQAVHTSPTETHQNKHCNTLQHTVTHCNTLQRTARHSRAVHTSPTATHRGTH